jgi:hypothetical protein
VSKKNLTSPIGTSSTLKIVKNILKLKKLWPPKVEGLKTQKTNHQTLQSQFLITQEIPCMLLYCY